MLPVDFIFSQQNLQDFMDCPQRFYLHSIQKLDWPAVETEPVLEQEKLVDLGYRFHLLIQQVLSGVPRELIESMIQETQLLRWWNAFQQLDLNLSRRNFFAEESLVAPFEGRRIMAKFDLLLFDPQGQILIYDWKTSRVKPTRSHYINRAQTMVYPFVLTLAGNSLSGIPQVDPAQIEMRYWFPEFPESTISFFYSAEQHERIFQKLTGLISDINNRNSQRDFEKTDNLQLCKYCRYRSLCDRGVGAEEPTEGEVIAHEEESNPFDQDFDL